MAILPLQQPPQYLTGMQSPLAAASEGLQLGAGLAQTRLAGEAQQQARQQRTQQQAALQQYMQNPTMQGLLQIAPMLPPEMVKNIAEANKMLSEEQRTNSLQFGGSVLGFLEAGRTDDAIGLLRDRATAYRNSGDQVNATALDRLIRVVEIDPNAAKAIVGLNMAASPGGETFIRGISGLGGEQRARELQPSAVRTAQAGATTAEATAGVSPEAAAADVEKKMADIEKIRAEIADKQGEIPESARTIVNQSADAVLAARQRADRATSLAEKFTNSWQSGVFTRATDALGDAVGSQSEQRRFRQEFERLRSSEIVKSLPPGPATDRDIQLFSRGFPPPEADAETIKQFLQSVARVARYEEAFFDVRGQWAAANGQLGPARREFTIDGIQIPRGTTFTNFAKQYLGLAANRTAAQEAEALARSRSYGRVLEGPGQ
jgi:hypothetical protein